MLIGRHAFVLASRKNEVFCEAVPCHPLEKCLLMSVNRD